MSKEMILVSSGFIIPSNRLFSVVSKDSTYRDSILSKRNGTDKDIVLNELIKANALSSSNACNELYSAYIHDSTTDNFLNLVDAIAEVFRGISLKDFLMLQARNTYLSPVGFRLCMDLATCKLHETYREYLVTSSFFRVAKPTDNQAKEVNSRINQIEKALANKGQTSFPSELSYMMHNKGSIVAFFQYVLTDSNRGGLYG